MGFTVLNPRLAYARLAWPIYRTRYKNNFNSPKPLFEYDNFKHIESLGDFVDNQSNSCLANSMGV